MKRMLALVVIALCLAPPAAAQAVTAPVFFAVSVADLDASIQWYSRMLDLAVTRLPDAGDAKVALLRGDGLVVELLEHGEAFSLESRLPELERRYLGYGLFKVGFHVPDLDAAVARLTARGAEFRGAPFTDPVLGARSILLLDNSGNTLQLFQRLSTP